jgi:hypothetical protein
LLGFALVWPVVLLCLLGVIRHPYARVFALAAMAFFILQAYARPYDIWRGRYSITAGLLAVPPLAFVFMPARRAGRAYLAIVVALGSISAMTASLFRLSSFVLPIDVGGRYIESVFAPPPEIPPSRYAGKMSHEAYRHLSRRLYQLTREFPEDLYFGMLKYELQVPASMSLR